MDELTEPASPDYLANMHLATTPQQFFEKADNMLLEAATIKDQAETLAKYAQKMHDKAFALQDAAFSLQKLGMQDREKSTKVLNETLERYRDILPQYNLEKPRFIENLVLAVEEGRAHLEDVEVLDDKLQAFFDAYEITSSTPPRSEDDFECHHRQVSSRGGSEEDTPELSTNLDCPDDKFSSEHLVNQDHLDLVAVPDKLDHQITEEDSSDISSISQDFKASPSKSKKATISQPEVGVIYKRRRLKKAKSNTKRRSRNIALLRQMGYDIDEIPKAILDNVKALPEKRRRKPKKAKKGIKHQRFDSP